MIISETGYIVSLPFKSTIFPDICWPTMTLTLSDQLNPVFCKKTPELTIPIFIRDVTLDQTIFYEKKIHFE